MEGIPPSIDPPFRGTADPRGTRSPRRSARRLIFDCRHWSWAPQLVKAPGFDVLARHAIRKYFAGPVLVPCYVLSATLLAQLRLLLRARTGAPDDLCRFPCKAILSPRSCCGTTLVPTAPSQLSRSLTAGKRWDAGTLRDASTLDWMAAGGRKVAGSIQSPRSLKPRVWSGLQALGSAGSRWGEHSWYQPRYCSTPGSTWTAVRANALALE